MQRPRGRNELGVWEEERRAGVQRGSRRGGRSVRQTPGPRQNKEMPVSICGVRDSLKEGTQGHWMGSKAGSWRHWVGEAFSLGVFVRGREGRGG